MPGQTHSLDRSEDIFAEARDQFLSSLTPEHRARLDGCRSAEDFLNDIRKWDIVLKQKRNAERYLAPIKALSDSLTPYFAVVESFVNSNPEFAALAWGAFRLVLQLASNFVTFFEKLTKAIKRLADALPQYAQIAEICTEDHSPGLRSSLYQVYGDILHFFQAVVRIFTKSNGKIKATPTVIGALAWKPFDERFQDIIDDLQHHQGILRDELTLRHFRATKQGQNAAHEDWQKAAEERRKAERARNDQVKGESTSLHMRQMEQDAAKRDQVQKIRTWIDAPDFAQDYEQVLDKRENDTSHWIFAVPLYEQWRDADLTSAVLPKVGCFGPAVLWIHGVAGCGKTVIAASIIEDLKRSLDVVAGMNFAVFYYFLKDRGRPPDHIAVHRALLAQVFHHYKDDEQVIDKFNFAMSNTSHGQIRASPNELSDLLDACIVGAKNAVFVLDGIDECSDAQSLVQSLMRVDIGRNFRLILLSRQNVASLLKSVPETQRLAMTKSSVSPDIRSFVYRNLCELRDDGMLPQESDTVSLTENLVHGAEGMFLWAGLMISFLSSHALTPSQRLDTIQDIQHPEEIRSMYIRILQLIARAPKIEQEMAIQIFNWLICSRRTLMADELQAALLCGRSKADEIEREAFTNFSNTVVLSCGGLVEPYKTTPTTVLTEQAFQFIHLSAMEFVCSLSTSDLDVPKNLYPLLRSKEETEVCLADICLQYLTYHMPAHPLSSRSNADITREALRQSFPFATYASLYWIQHLFRVTSNLSLDNTKRLDLHHAMQLICATLKRFISLPSVVMAWIEASYLSVSADAHSGSLQSCYTGLQILGTKMIEADYDYPELWQDCLDFSHDLMLLDKGMGTALSAKPRLIWDEATAFVASKFWTKTASTSVKFLDPTSAQKQNSSSQSLCTISGTSLREDLVGVLSIWPSRKYEEFWSAPQQSIQRLQASKRLRAACKGWLAKYEVWSVEETPMLRLKTTISLSYDEIWLAIYQSLHKKNGWKMHFPLTISEDILSFVILRTLYTVVLSEGALVKSTVVPVLSDGFIVLGSDLNDTLTTTARDVFMRDILRQRIVRKHFAYTYRFFFSPDCRLLYFADFNGTQEVCRPLILLFDVNNGGSQVTLRAEATHRPCYTPEKLAFHPTYPILFLLRAHDDICVWQYDVDICQFDMPLPPCIYQSSYFRHTLTDALKSNMDGLPSFSRQYKSSCISDIAVSRCGGYLSIAYGSEVPLIIPLPTYWLELSFAPRPVCNSSNSKDGNQSAPTKTDLEVQSFSRGHTLAGAMISSGDDGSVTLLNVVHSAHNLTLQQWDGEGETTMSLSALPTWPSIQDSKATVKWPSRKEQWVNIILNKVAKPAYNLSHPSPQSGPLVIQRDQRMLNLPRRRILPQEVCEQSSPNDLSECLSHATVLKRRAPDCSTGERGVPSTVVKRIKAGGSRPCYVCPVSEEDC